MRLLTINTWLSRCQAITNWQRWRVFSLLYFNPFKLCFFSKYLANFLFYISYWISVFACRPSLILIEWLFIWTFFNPFCIFWTVQKYAFDILFTSEQGETSFMRHIFNYHTPARNSVIPLLSSIKQHSVYKILSKMKFLLNFIHKLMHFYVK